MYVLINWLGILGFGFWVLFFVLVFFTLVKPEIIGLSKIYFSSFIGGLLIFNRIYLVEGRIKRIPYFLSLLAISFTMLILFNIMSSVSFLSSFSVLCITLFMSSYFSVLLIIAKVANVEFYKLIHELLGFKIPFDFVPILSLGLLSLAVFYPFVVLHVKRLRDIRLSYWWAFITLIPGVHILLEIFLCLKGSAKRRSRRIKQRPQRRRRGNKRR